jgi:hypothetical protein
MESHVTTTPEERRRSPRHAVGSIIYVQLGSANGAVLVNLGTDGLAFQAAWKLKIERGSTLNLRLLGGGLNTELVAQVVWLAATQKLVGICFKSLTEDAKQDIAQWIMRQQRVSHAVPLPKASEDKLPPAKDGDAAVTSISLASTPARTSVTPLSSSGARTAVARRSERLDVAQQSTKSGFLEKADSATQEGQAELERYWLYRKRLGPSSTALNEPSIDGVSASASATAEPLPQPETPVREDKASAETSQTAGELPAQERKSKGLRAGWQQRLMAVRTSLTHQQKILLASATAILVCLLTLNLSLANLQNRSRNRASVHDAGVLSTLPNADNDSRPGPGSTMTRVGSASHSQNGIAHAVSNLAGESHSPHVAGEPQTATSTTRTAKTTSFFTGVAAVFGSALEKKADIDAQEDNVQVWVSKTSGYYYCSGSRYYRVLQPGALMTQGSALQTGYQPKLGQACE